IIMMIVFVSITVWLQMGATEKELKHTSIQNGILYSYITNIEKIKSAGMERRAFAIWLDSYKKSADPRYNPPLLVKLKPVFTRGISLLGTLLFYRAALKTHITPSRYMGFQASFALLIAAFMQLFDVIQNFAMIRPILKNVKPILDASPELMDNKKTISSMTGAITLSNVTFRYEDSPDPILRDLNLTIHSGEYVAIVGHSGCGKSTLMRLLLGFEHPQSGSITFDGNDMASLNIQSLRRQFGCVMQNDRLFPGSIQSNILISAPDQSEERAWEAAELAGIAEDIRRMPMGMHTLISEGASTISGGQRQRLIIARAIAGKPRILLMDEATSALDNITQKTVSDSLDRLNVTRIIIAHRLSTVRHCDRILVLHEGRIAEEGTYEELIEKDGLFADLIRFQQT
ncbi:MAG: ATP-binding cassette domain-containing protein, partial [Lachnospiraceae bacterium]|nr:ATP-binding cassette domain-containing protein [Lachnospiraceae bacterium]